MTYDSNPKSFDPYAPGRDVFKRYMLVLAYCQSDVDATSELISALQSEVAKRGLPRPRKS